MRISVSVSLAVLVSALALSLGVNGCAPKGPTTPPGGPSPTSSSATSSSPSHPAGPGASGATGPFDVHEWGVIDVSASGIVEVGAGPGAPFDEAPRPVKKPVLYFHLDKGAAPLEISVKARIPAGQMLEVWPTGQLGGDAITWPKVRLAACPSPYPSFAERSAQLAPPGYPTRDGFNEVRELGGYETGDAACVTSDGVLGRLLFYRGATRGARLPIEVVRDPDGTPALRASMAGSGPVFFVAGGGRGIALSWPAVDRPVGLPTAFTESFDGAAQTRLLERAILERGLTPDETKAFLRAWSQPFFGVRTAATGNHGPAAATCAARLEPQPSLIYLMPDTSVASVAELTITPRPRSVKRVLVVRIELP